MYEKAAIGGLFKFCGVKHIASLTFLIKKLNESAQIIQCE
jgi:hypothetical protein